MTMERWIRFVGGAMILASLALAVQGSQYWLLLAVFVGANLFQSALTRWCLLEDILARLGVKRCEEGSDRHEPTPE